MRLSDAEWAVMQAVWIEAPASARDVLERVEDERGWAYTTVKTLLARLVEKGALVEKKRANTSYYEPAVTRDEARRAAVGGLLERAFGGSFGELVAHMVKFEKLSKRDRTELAKRLAAEERKR